MKLENNVHIENAWAIYETEFVPEQVVTTGSNYMIGNGYLGYRGTFADDGRDQYVACVVSDTYDNADGVWKELVTAPNGLFTELAVNGTSLPWREAGSTGYRRSLDVRYGRWQAEVEWKRYGVTVREERFAGYDDLHRLASRMDITAQRPLRLSVRTGIDGDIWSLNGDHFSSYTSGEDEEELEIACVTGEHGYDVVVREISRLTFSDGMNVASRLTERETRKIIRTFDLDLEAGQTVTLTKYAAVWTTNDLRTSANPHTQISVPATVPGAGYLGIAPGERSLEASSVADPERPPLAAVQAAASRTLTTALERGWDELWQAHCAEWDQRWQDMDVEITGDAQRYGMLLQTYLDASSLSFIDVSIDASATYGLAMWDVAGGEIDLGNTTFSNSHDYDLVASLANIDATGA
ncbi:MAG: hypothetical protein ACOCU4_01965, partial [Alkalispirochaeta sp.]